VNESLVSLPDDRESLEKGPNGVTGVIALDESCLPSICAKAGVTGVTNNELPTTNATAAVNKSIIFDFDGLRAEERDIRI
jgi:hypothetical protein